VGNWTLGPVEVPTKRSTISAEARTIEVLPRPDTDANHIRIRAELSNLSPYVGETLIYDLSVLTRDIIGRPSLEYPDFGGLVEDPSAEASQNTIAETLDGLNFRGSQIVVPLRAVTGGTHRIAPSILQANLMRSSRRARRSRGSAEAVRWASEGFNIQVRPLPSTGKPADFSGLVGRFRIQVETSKQTIQLGESVTLKITVTGDGILDGFTLPLPPEGAPYQVYDEPTETRAQLIRGAYRAEAHLQRDLVPEEAGPLVIPAIEISSFNPETERFEWIRSETIEIDVKPSPDGRRQLTSYSEASPEESMDEDIIPAARASRVWAQTIAAVLPLAIALPALPLVALLSMGLLSGLKSRRAVPERQRRAQLRGLPRDPKERLTILARLVHESMAEHLNIEVGAVDMEAATRLGPDSAELYQDLMRSRYGDRLTEDIEARAISFIRRGPR